MPHNVKSSFIKENQSHFLSNVERDDKFPNSKLFPSCFSWYRNETDLGYHQHLADLDLPTYNDPFTTLKPASVSSDPLRCIQLEHHPSECD